mmetsp:Transcript_27072/g.33814  ORF Transcript_27072/g.33814 Transcript_27072/m.33814 type:complete len:1234 (-) Transcript_27072:413-4114(-)
MGSSKVLRVILLVFCACDFNHSWIFEFNPSPHTNPKLTKRTLLDLQRPLFSKSLNKDDGDSLQVTTKPKNTKKNITQKGPLTVETFRSQLKGIPKSQRWKKAQSIIKEASNEESSRIPLAVYQAALDHYRGGGRWREARKQLQYLRRNGPHPDKNYYDTTIGCCQRTAAFGYACQVLRQMQRDPHVTPDLYSYRGVFNAFNTTFPVQSRARFMQHVFKKRNLTMEHDFHEAIIRQSIYESNIKFALRILRNEMPNQNIIPKASAYSVMINSLMIAEDYKTVLDLFGEMQEYSVKPDERTFSNVITAASCSDNPEKASKILRDMKSAGYKPDRFSLGHVASGWKKAGDWRQLLAFIESIENDGGFVDPFIYRKALHTFVKAKQWEAVTQTFEKLKPSLLGASTTLTTLDINCAINAYAIMGKWKEASSLVTEMQKHGITPDVVSYNSAIHACGKAYELYEALSLLEEMDEVGLAPDIITFTTLLTACERAPYPKIAHRLLTLMKRFHLRPNSEIINKAVTSSFHAEEWETAVDIIEASVNGKKLGSRTKATVGSNVMALLQVMPETSQTVYERLLVCLEKCSQAQKAKELMKMMRESGFMPTKSSYESLVGACVAGDDPEGFINTLMEMSTGSIYPTKETFAHAFGCLKLSNQPYRCAEKLLYLVLHSDHIPNSKVDLVPYYENAIEACAAAGELKEAWLLLAGAMREEVAVGQPTYSAVMKACTKKKSWEQTTSVLEQMRLHSATPTYMDYHRGIKAASMCNDIAKALSFMEMMGADGLKPDIYCYRAVMKMCVLQKEWQLALELLHRMNEQFGNNFGDGPAYHYTLEALAAAGQWDKIPEVFEEMKVKGVQLLEDEYSLVMQVWGKKGRWQDVLAVLNDMTTSGLQPSLKTYNIVLDAIGKSGLWEMAEKFFNNLVSQGIIPDEVTYGTMIHSYGTGEQLSKVFEMLDTMKANGVNPTTKCYNNALYACKQADNWEAAVAVLALMQKNDVNMTTVTFGSAISVCEQAGAYEKAIELFFRMQNLNIETDVRVYNSVLSACFKVGMPELASKLMVEMREQGVEHNELTYTTVVTAAARDGNAALALRVLDQMHERDIQANTQICTAAMTACIKDNLPRKAVKVFEKMVLKGIRPNKVTYAEMFRALCDQKHWQRITELFEEMVTHDIKPELHSLNTAMLAYNRLGQYYKTLMIYEALKIDGVKPDDFAEGLAATALNQTMEYEKIINGNSEGAS